MASPSPERGRSRTRSHTPTGAKHQSPVQDHSPRRSISPRSASRSRSPARTSSPRNVGRRNGVKGGRARSRSPSRTPSRSRSEGREGRKYRDRSYTRSASPVPRSSKVVQRPCSTVVVLTCCRSLLKDLQRTSTKATFVKYLVHTVQSAKLIFL